MGDHGRVHSNHKLLSIKVDFVSTGGQSYEKKTRLFPIPCRFRSICASVQ